MTILCILLYQSNLWVSIILMYKSQTHSNFASCMRPIYSSNRSWHELPKKIDKLSQLVTIELRNTYYKEYLNFFNIYIYIESIDAFCFCLVHKNINDNWKIQRNVPLNFSSASHCKPVPLVLSRAPVSSDFNCYAAGSGFVWLLCGIFLPYKMYSNRYWELFNEIDGEFNDVAVRTFKMGLPMNSDLRKSLTMKLARDMH